MVLAPRWLKLATLSIEAGRPGARQIDQKPASSVEVCHSGRRHARCGNGGRKASWGRSLPNLCKGESLASTQLVRSLESCTGHHPDRSLGPRGRAGAIHLSDSRGLGIPYIPHNFSAAVLSETRSSPHIIMAAPTTTDFVLLHQELAALVSGALS